MAAPAHIVIVGAGPGGAMLAYLLASRGGDHLRVTLIERQHDFEREFRGEVLMPSGVEVFHQAGLTAQFADVPQYALRRATLYSRRRYVGSLALDVLGPEAAFTAVSQPAMLELLVSEASRFGNFTFDRGVAVRDLVIEADRVRGVEIADQRQMRRIDADLVIGADGRASLVRRKAGLEVVRRPQTFDIVWCKVPAPSPAIAAMPPHTANVYLADRHFALAFQTYDQRVQMAWVIRKGAIGELRSRGVAHWIDEMANHVSPAFGRHLREHLQQITHPFLLDVICDLMPQWTRPGLLLLGDAAHPMSPVGGQGINIALRDAVVAANHLVEATRSGGDRVALDEVAAAIQHERMPEVERIQRLQQFPPRLLFGMPAVTRMLVRIAPILAWTGAARIVATLVLRRFAFGDRAVRLRV